MAIGLFVAIPLFAIVYYLSFGVGEMWGHITQHFLFGYIKNSAILLVGTGILTILLGVSSAWVVSNYQFPGRKIISYLLFLPLAIPSYIMAYAYVGLLGNGGSLTQILNSLGISMKRIEMMNIYGLIWVLSCSLYPYVYGGCRAMLLTFPKQIKETAFLLGASKKRYFFRIALPLISPAIIGGVFLVSMEVLNDYGAAKYYGVNTFTTGIFRTWTALEDLQSAIYLSALLVILVFGLQFWVTWTRRKKSYALKQGDSKFNSREALKGIKALLYYGVVSVPLVFGLLIPLCQLFYWASLSFDEMFNNALASLALESFGIAILSAGLCVVIAVFMVYFSRWNHFRSFNIFGKISTMGYVIPGAIIGIGIIRSSQSVIDFFKDNFNQNIGYLFYGSIFILIYAYIFRFLAVAYHPIAANSTKVGKKLSEASSMLGKTKTHALLRVELPLIKNALISAFLMVFIDVLKELPLTLILKPYDINTLAVRAFEYADDERVAQAALPALCIITVIAITLLILNIIMAKLKTNEDLMTKN